jgi:hypothetical protein
MEWAVLEGWENFYFMLGSAGAGLIGLLFVVVTLTAGFERSLTSRGNRLYMTPTLCHFAIVFTLSGIAIAPRLPAALLPAVIALVALVGVTLALRSTIGIGGRLPPTVEAPHWSDAWLYGIAPGVIYAGILAAAAGLWLGWPDSDVAMAALLLGLLLLCVRNAWDLVTWIAPLRKGGD